MKNKYDRFLLKYAHWLLWGVAFVIVEWMPDNTNTVWFGFLCWGMFWCGMLACHVKEWVQDKRKEYDNTKEYWFKRVEAAPSATERRMQIQWALNKKMITPQEAEDLQPDAEDLRKEIQKRLDEETENQMAEVDALREKQLIKKLANI